MVMMIIHWQSSFQLSVVRNLRSITRVLCNNNSNEQGLYHGLSGSEFSNDLKTFYYASLELRLCSLSIESTATQDFVRCFQIQPAD